MVDIGEIPAYLPRTDASVRAVLAENGWDYPAGMFLTIGPWTQTKLPKRADGSAGPPVAIALWEAPVFLSAEFFSDPADAVQTARRFGFDPSQYNNRVIHTGTRCTLVYCADKYRK